MDTSKIQDTNGDIKGWFTFASGSVNNVYPNPIMPNTLLELAVIEDQATDLGYDKVSYILTNTFKSGGYMGETVEYQSPTLNGRSLDHCRGEGEEMLDTDIFRFSITKPYSSYKQYDTKAKSLTDLVANLLRDGVRGCFTATFRAHYIDNDIESQHTVDIIL